MVESPASLLDDLLGDLSPEPRAATQVPPPLRIVAPAGSGKTLVLTRRIAVQLTTGRIHATATAVLTFTRAAAFELQRRLRRTLRGPLPTTNTVHAAALSWLAEVARLRGERLPRIESVDELVRRVAPPLTPREHQLLLATLRGSPPPTERIATLATAYTRYCAEHSVLDLDGVIAALAHRLEREPALRDDLGIEWLFVDEFQDSTPAQLRLFRALLGPDLRGLTVVGDPNQSIYAWNGADPSVLTELDVPGMHTVTLTTNYRSRDTLVQSCASVLHPPPLVRGARPGGPPPVVRGFSHPDDEAQSVVRELSGLHNQGVRWRAMAVLARTSRALGAVDAALARAGIPSVTLGHDRVLARLRQRFASLRQSATPLRVVLDELSSSDSDIDDDLLEHVRSQVADLLRADPMARVEDLRDVLDERLARRLNAVTLATFHRAKGLEWFHVRLIDVGARSLPHPGARSAERRAEERRLLYVAMTRATDSLSLSWSDVAPSVLLQPLLAELTAAHSVAPASTVGRARTPSPSRRALLTQRARFARALGVAPHRLVSDAALEGLLRSTPRSYEALLAHLTETPASVREALAHSLWRVIAASYGEKSATSGA